MEPTLSLDTIPPEILSAAAKVSEWCEKNEGPYWQLAGLCDRRHAFRAELDENLDKEEYPHERI
jgi:hypothetical protein